MSQLYKTGKKRVVLKMGRRVKGGPTYTVEGRIIKASPAEMQRRYDYVKKLVKSGERTKDIIALVMSDFNLAESTAENFVYGNKTKIRRELSEARLKPAITVGEFVGNKTRAKKAPKAEKVLDTAADLKRYAAMRSGPMPHPDNIYKYGLRLLKYGPVDIEERHKLIRELRKEFPINGIDAANWIDEFKQQWAEDLNEWKKSGMPRDSMQKGIDLLDEAKMQLPIIVRGRTESISLNKKVEELEKGIFVSIPLSHANAAMIILEKVYRGEQLQSGVELRTVVSLKVALNRGIEEAVLR